MNRMACFVAPCLQSTSPLQCVATPDLLLPRLPACPPLQTLGLYCSTAHGYDERSFDTRGLVAQLTQLESLALVGWVGTRLSGLPRSLHTLIVDGVGAAEHPEDLPPTVNHPSKFAIPMRRRCCHPPFGNVNVVGSGCRPVKGWQMGDDFQSRPACLLRLAKQCMACSVGMHVGPLVQKLLARVYEAAVKGSIHRPLPCCCLARRLESAAVVGYRTDFLQLEDVVPTAGATCCCYLVASIAKASDHGCLLTEPVTSMPCPPAGHEGSCPRVIYSCR